MPHKIPLINHDYETVEKVTKGLFRYKNKLLSTTLKYAKIIEFKFKKLLKYFNYKDADS